jgi:hypothetical protein
MDTGRSDNDIFSSLEEESPKELSLEEQLAAYRNLKDNFMLMGGKDERHEDSFEDDLASLDTKLTALLETLPEYITITTLIQKNLGNPSFQLSETDEKKMQSALAKLLPTFEFAAEVHNRLDQKKLLLTEFVNQETVNKILEVERTLLEKLLNTLPLDDGVRLQNRSLKRPDVRHAPLDFRKEEVAPISDSVSSNLGYQLVKDQTRIAIKKDIAILADAIRNEENETIRGHYVSVMATLKEMDTEVKKAPDASSIKTTGKEANKVGEAVKILIQYMNFYKKDQAILTATASGTAKPPALKSIETTLQQSFEMVLDNLKKDTLHKVSLPEEMIKLHQSVQDNQAKIPTNTFTMFGSTAMNPVRMKIDTFLKDTQLQREVSHMRELVGKKTFGN